MKICLVAHGGNVFALQHARAFQQQGHQVELFSLGPAADKAGDVPVRSFTPPGFDPATDSSRTPYLKAILPVRRAIAQSKPDIVFALYLSSAGVVASFAGHPRLVVSARGCDVNRWINVPPWPAVFYAQAKVARLVHTVSRPLADTLHLRAKVPRSKLFVSPLGIDCSLFAPADPDKRPGSCRLICTRSHDPVYDQPTLVKALGLLAARSQPCHLVFAHPRKAEETKRVVQEAGLQSRVTFMPGYQLSELPELLAGHDIYVSASIRDGTSSSLLEAMATGLFPVVSDIEANREWIEDGVNGLLFPVGDADALAQQLQRASADRELVRRAGRLNPMLVRHRGDLVTQTRALLDRFESLM